MVFLGEDHPEMAEAIVKARATLPEFIERLRNPDGRAGHFALKARFKVENGHEHIWVGDLEVVPEGFKGKLANDPNEIKGVKLGDEVSVRSEMVTDWGYAIDGVYQGHHTTKVLLRHMSGKMRRQVEAAYGWTEGVPPRFP